MAVASMDAVPEGGTHRVMVAGEPVCLYRLGDAIYATHDTCTHGVASLSEGYVDGEHIECPMHQGLFHIPTGKATGAPCTHDVRVFPVRVEQRVILIHPSKEMPCTPSQLIT